MIRFILWVIAIILLIGLLTKIQDGTFRDWAVDFGKEVKSAVTEVMEDEK